MGFRVSYQRGNVLIRKKGIGEDLGRWKAEFVFNEYNELWRVREQGTYGNASIPWQVYDICSRWPARCDMMAGNATVPAALVEQVSGPRCLRLW